jgi:hypothetical protein
MSRSNDPAREGRTERTRLHDENFNTKSLNFMGK